LPIIKEGGFMNKQKLFLDYDMTIVNSIKPICEIYNQDFANYKDFKPAIWQEVSQWDFKDQCPLMDNCNRYFSDKRFFDKVEFLEGNTKEIIDHLTKQYHVIICTLGTPRNLAYKSMWLEDNLPKIHDYILLRNYGIKMDKSIVDMRGGIFVDDVYSNIESSNADVKILFGNDYEWNKYEGVGCQRIKNWSDLYMMLK
jgi:hypothetical protein